MKKIVVGEGSCGIAAGAAKVYSAIEPLIEGSGIELKITGCIGMCYLEPIVDVYDDDTLLQRLVLVTEKDAQRVMDAAKTADFSGVEDLKIKDEDKEFLSKQTRIALRNCGIVDPTDIKDYQRRGGYEALRKVLTTMSQDDVIDVINVGH